MFRHTYWSCSKFADKVRGTPKPNSGTAREWRLWTKAAKEAHPFRYWLAEDALDTVRETIIWPYTKLDALRYYIVNRWVTRSHALTAHPRNVKPGSWCDLGERILPCLFNELVEFVEVEAAWHNCVWDEAAHRKHKVPRWRSSWPYWRTWRSAASGMEYFAWASTLTNKDFLPEDEKHLAEPTTQAIAAKEIIELYRWWTEVYPNRPDPSDESGWSAYCDNKRGDGDLFEMLDDLSDDENVTEDEILAKRLDSQIPLNKLIDIETAYENEDTEMLTRLIKIRKSLWT